MVDLEEEDIIGVGVMEAPEPVPVVLIPKQDVPAQIGEFLQFQNARHFAAQRDRVGQRVYAAQQEQQEERRTQTSSLSHTNTLPRQQNEAWVRQESGSMKFNLSKQQPSKPHVPEATVPPTLLRQVTHGDYLEGIEEIQGEAGRLSFSEASQTTKPPLARLSTLSTISSG